MKFVVQITYYWCTFSWYVKLVVLITYYWCSVHDMWSLLFWQLTISVMYMKCKVCCSDNLLLVYPTWYVMFAVLITYYWCTVHDRWSLLFPVDYEPYKCRNQLDQEPCSLFLTQYLHNGRQYGPEFGDPEEKHIFNLIFIIQILFANRNNGLMELLFMVFFSIQWTQVWSPCSPSLDAVLKQNKLFRKCSSINLAFFYFFFLFCLLFFASWIPLNQKCSSPIIRNGRKCIRETI